MSTVHGKVGKVSLRLAKFPIATKLLAVDLKRASGSANTMADLHILDDSSKPGEMMKKYGWEWKSNDAADVYKRILIETVSHGGGFGGEDGLASFVKMADELVRLEGRVPETFVVAVDLGHIYSTAAMSAEAGPASQGSISKASEAWAIASKFVLNGNSTDPDILGDSALRTSYMSRYWQIPCETGFAKFLQTHCKEVAYLKEIRVYWQNAKREGGTGSVLDIIGKYIHQELDNKPHPQSESQAASPKDKGGCFIATAVYGGPESSPEVVTLQRFRDEILNQSRLGRAGVKVYYILSPHIARGLSRSSLARQAVKSVVLDPIVKALRLFLR